MASIASLDQFQAQSIWEMSAHAKIATVYGNQPVDVMHAKLLCECWNAVTSVAERLGEDPLKVARKLKRGELVDV
jgi:hypothetical protein